MDQKENHTAKQVIMNHDNECEALWSNDKAKRTKLFIKKNKLGFPSQNEVKGNIYQEKPKQGITNQNEVLQTKARHYK